MHKVLIGLMVIFFLGDPGMQTLAWLEALYCCCGYRDGLHTLCDLSNRRMITARWQPDTARAAPPQGQGYTDPLSVALNI